MSQADIGGVSRECASLGTDTPTVWLRSCRWVSALTTVFFRLFNEDLLMRICILLISLMLIGCSNSGPSNIVENADQKAMEEYEKALAEADALMEGDTDFEQ